MSLKACSASVGTDGAGCATAGVASLAVPATGVSPAAASGGGGTVGGAVLASVAAGGGWSGGVAGVSALAGAAGSAVCANAAAGTSSVARARWSPFERIRGCSRGRGSGKHATAKGRRDAQAAKERSSCRRYARRSSASPSGLPSICTPSPAIAASSASRARPALSTRGTADRSKRLMPASCLGTCGHNTATAARSRVPVKARVSSCRVQVAVMGEVSVRGTCAPGGFGGSRRTLAGLLAGFRLQLARLEVGGDLRDRLAVERAIELRAEGLHEAHAFDHHVEHLPAGTGVAHEVVDRHGLAALAQELAGDAHAAAVG